MGLCTINEPQLLCDDDMRRLQGLLTNRYIHAVILKLMKMEKLSGVEGAEKMALRAGLDKASAKAKGKHAAAAAAQRLPSAKSAASPSKLEGLATAATTVIAASVVSAVAAAGGSGQAGEGSIAALLELQDGRQVPPRGSERPVRSTSAPRRFQD